MEDVIGYVNDDNEIRGECFCGFELKNLIIDSNDIDNLEVDSRIMLEEKCPRCDRKIKIKKIEITADFRCLKVIKNKLERRCISLILDSAIYKVLDYYVEYLDNEINISLTETSYNSYKFNFNNKYNFYLDIIGLNIINEFSKFEFKSNLYIEDKEEFNIKVEDTIYY